MRPEATPATGATEPSPEGSPGGILLSDRRYRFEIWQELGQPWDALLATFADACLEQMAAYTVPRWGGSRLCGLVLREVATSEPVALALAVMATIPLIKYGLAYVKFGPLWRRQGRPADPAVLAAMLDALKQAFAIECGLVARVMPPPDPDFETEWKAALSATAFTALAPLPDADRYLVDLRLSEAEQLASLGANWRANLKKAHKSNLDMRELDPREGLADFMALFQQMLARKQFVDRHHVDALPSLVAAAPLGQLRLFLAYHDGRPVAGSILVGGGDRVFAAYSASSEAALALRAGYALRWWVLGQLRGSNARWLDLGGDEGDAGLKSFKLGNVGKRGRVVTMLGEYDFAGNALSNLISAAMSSTRKLMQAHPAQHLLGRHRA
jgi:hypothetical protein